MGRQTLHRFPFCLTTPLLDFGDYERRRFQHGLALIRLITRLMSVPYLAVLQRANELSICRTAVGLSCTDVGMLDLQALAVSI